jgi:DNA polymerase III subunit delta'
MAPDRNSEPPNPERRTAMFSSISGHRRLLALLARAIAHERLPPSLLFAGPSGVGKRRTAIAVAATLNCLNSRRADHGVHATAPAIDACGACASCRRIARGVHPDIIMVEPGDSGSIKVEQVREVIERAAYRPFEARRRVVIVDEADAMMASAQSALLKTLEEPPSASVFVLVSSRPDALLPTVISRCPRLRFGPLSAPDVAAVLVRDHEYDEADAHAAAADAGGSVGRALEIGTTGAMDAREAAQRLLQQAARISDPVRRLEIARDLSAGKATPAVERERLAACLRATASLLRDISILSVGADARVLANTDIRGTLDALSRTFDAERAASAHTAVDEALTALDRNASPKVVADWLAVHL